MLLHGHENDTVFVGRHSMLFLLRKLKPKGSGYEAESKKQPQYKAHRIGN
jgi:hypothetical protein